MQEDAWIIHSPEVATKRMDTSCFSTGTHIPEHIKAFFQVEDLELGRKLPATLIFRDKRLECNFKKHPSETNPNPNPRLSWQKLKPELRRLFPHIYSVIDSKEKPKKKLPKDFSFPLIRFKKLDQDQTYEIDFLPPDRPLDRKPNEIGPAEPDLQVTDVVDTPPPPETLENGPEIQEDLSSDQTSEMLADLFLSASDFDQMLKLLAKKKNVILQGPPGVGKSYIAKRLAYELIGVKDPTRVSMIQFHQTYSYEDFIQGYRPIPDGTFQLKNGVFYEFCKTASTDSATPYVFIIDEINRGNLSKIFGELMLLIEADKRSPEYALALTYSKRGDDLFYIPPNIHLIGMMNTADRSLAMVDYALRRRFRFIDLKPEFASPKFRQYLLEMGVGESLIGRIVEKMQYINHEIAEDTGNLGKGYCIGHSFFCPETMGEHGEDWYREIILFEIAPLIREYWFDKPEKAESTVARLLR